MIVGDKTTFAVEYHISSVMRDARGEEWPWGRAAFWCSGAEVGTIDDERSLRAFVGYLENEVGRRGARKDIEVAALPAAAVLDLVDRAMYADDDRTDAQVREDVMRYGPLVQDADILDGNLVVVVEGAADVRVLCRNLTTHVISEARIEPGRFETVLEGARAGISELASSLSDRAARR